MMERKHSFRTLSVMFIVGILLISCAKNEDVNSPSSQCGDGICDSREQEDPNLCPEDCVELVEGPSESITTCEQEEWALIIDGCTISQGTEPSATMCVYMNACINIDSSCKFEGIAYGNYKDCAYTSPTGVCTYEVTCPDFQMPVSGEVFVDEDGQTTFQVMVDASGVFENVIATCAGVTVPQDTSSMLQIGFGSAVRNTGGIFAEVVIGESGIGQAEVVGKDSFVPNNLSYDYTITLMPGCD
jgi:hypothetical protein